jgi:hypothetical protein
MVGFMPRAMRVDRLRGEHGIGQDAALGRQEFERQMERRRLEALAEEALKPLRRGWYWGSEQFKEQMLELMEGKLGESHSRERRRTTINPNGCIRPLPCSGSRPAAEVQAWTGDRQRGQVRAPSSGSEPRPTQNRKSP